jgi:hypothetical protein
MQRFSPGGVLGTAAAVLPQGLEVCGTTTPRNISEFMLFFDFSKRP